MKLFCPKYSDENKKVSEKGYCMLPDLGEIKTRRKQLGLTQTQLAAQAGVSQSLITKVEAGRLVPAYANAKRIFDALEAQVQENTLRASDVMTTKIISAKPDASISSAVKLMKKHSVSQIPVMDGGIVVGSFSERHIIERMHSKNRVQDIGKSEVQAVMGDSMPIVQEATPFSVVGELLEQGQGVLVARKGKIKGIVTKADLLNVVLMGKRQK